MKSVLAAGLLAATWLGSVEGRSQGDVGWLEVASDPPAEVFIDGIDTGRVTPQPRLALSAGHHRLRLVSTDGARARGMGFTVEAGRVTKLTIHLAQ